MVHNAIDVSKNGISNNDEFRKAFFVEQDIPDDAVLAVTAGRLSPEKGHKYMVEAIGILKEKIKNTYFVFCGDGVKKNGLQQQAKDLGINNNCRFVGFRRDIPIIFNIMDFMILPSLTEGLPNVVLESFAAKKTVVATDVGGVPEIVEDNVNGLIVPSQRSDLLADGIMQLIDSKELCQKMGVAGFETVKSRFSFDNQNRKFESIYLNILDK